MELLNLKNWIISIKKPFWNEFKKFKNLHLSFKHSISKLKKQKEVQKKSNNKKYKDFLLLYRNIKFFIKFYSKFIL